MLHIYYGANIHINMKLKHLLGRLACSICLRSSSSSSGSTSAEPNTSPSGHTSLSMKIFNIYILHLISVRGCCSVLSLTDLAARSSAKASGPSRASRASCTRTIASVRCSSSGVSDVASNGTVFSVKAPDTCRQRAERWY